ncbi:MAG: acyltransferase 3 [Chthonomonadaceae bacterium]|nr:acyltransferase 3 [Chthonomonadaceae bacterium]
MARRETTDDPRATLEGLTRRGHDNNFDILRVFWAVMVLFSHCFALPKGDNSHEPLAVLTNAQTTFGSLAVDAFFVISGFLIAQSWLRSKGQADYLRKRVLRIYPGFLVAALFCVGIVGPLASASTTAYLHELHPVRLLGSVATLSLPTPPIVFAHLPFHGEINGSLWTIRYEFWCYLLLAALGGLGLLQRRGAVAGLFLTVLLLHTAQEWFYPGIGQGNDVFKAGLLHGMEFPLLGNLDRWPRLLAFFLAGTVCFLYRAQIPRSPRLALVSVLLLVLCVRWGLNAMLPLCGTYLLLYAAGSPHPIGKALTQRADLSYGIYLYAFPVQQLLIQYLGAQINPFVLFVLAVPIVATIAWVSWKLVEQPALRRKKQT